MTRQDHPLYSTWKQMRSRCNTPSHHAYRNYGGRGIRVCERWDDFWKFAQDMGPRPNGMTLERIDNELDYTPRNCKWASRREQASNRRFNRKITYSGETLTVAEWARRTGIMEATLYYRVWRWGPELALSLPKNVRTHITRRDGRGRILESKGKR